MGLSVLLDSPTDIFDAVGGGGLLYAQIQALFGDLTQLFFLGTHLTNFKSIGVIAVVSFIDRAAIYRNDIAILDGFVGGQAVYNLFVD